MNTRRFVEELKNNPTLLDNISEPELRQFSFSELQQIAVIAVQNKKLNLLASIFKLVSIGKLNDGRTLFHYAIDTDSPETIDFLVQLKAPQLPDQDGNYPVHYAIANSKTHLLVDLLSHQNATDLRNANSDNCLDVLLDLKDLTFAIWLIEQKKCDLDKKTIAKLKYIIHQALLKKDYENLILLLKSKSVLGSTVMAEIVSTIPGMQDFSKSEILNYLLSRDAKTKELLFKAVVIKDRLDILQWLVQKENFSFVLKDELEHAIFLAASADAHYVVDWLLLTNKSLTNKTLNDQRTIAHVAAQYGSINTLKFIAKYYPDIVSRSEPQVKYLAAESGSVEALDLLYKFKKPSLKSFMMKFDESEASKDLERRIQHQIIISAMRHGHANVLIWARENNFDFNLDRAILLDIFRDIVVNNHHEVIAFFYKQFDLSKYPSLALDVQDVLVPLAITSGSKEVLESFFSDLISKNPTPNFINDLLATLSDVLIHQDTAFRHALIPIPFQTFLSTLNFILSKDHLFKQNHHDFIIRCTTNFSLTEKNEITKMIISTLERHIKQQQFKNVQKDLQFFLDYDFNQAFQFIFTNFKAIPKYLYYAFVNAITTIMNNTFPIHHPNHENFLKNLKQYLDFSIEMDSEELLSFIQKNLLSNSEKKLACDLMANKLEELYLNRGSNKSKIKLLLSTFAKIDPALCFQTRCEILCRQNNQDKAARVCLRAIAAKNEFEHTARIILAELLLNGLDMNEENTPLAHLFKADFPTETSETNELVVSHSSNSPTVNTLNITDLEAFAIFGRAIQAFYLIKDLPDSVMIRQRCHQILSGNLTADLSDSSIQTWLPEAKELFLLYAHYKQNFNDQIIMEVIRSCPPKFPTNLKVQTKDFWTNFVRLHTESASDEGSKETTIGKVIKETKSKSEQNTKTETAKIPETNATNINRLFSTSGVKDTSVNPSLRKSLDRSGC